VAGVSPDTDPPDTVIDSGPSGTINSSEATFAFSGNPAGDTAKIRCRIDGQPFADCTSPHTFTGLTDGPHTASFRAEDASGNQDPTPATRTFIVDTGVGPPVGTPRVGRVIVRGPARVKRNRKGTYRVSVKNTGDATATGVRLKVTGRGVRSSLALGSIPAGTTRTVRVKIRPRSTGRIVATFRVSSSNAGAKAVRKRITVRR
jgi:hypothetical protein